jgi:hypothetical protein
MLTEAGRVRRDALLKELYLGQDSHIVMLDDALAQPGSSVAIEDILSGHHPSGPQPLAAETSEPRGRRPPGREPS